MSKPTNDLPKGGPSGEVVPAPPPSFPPATTPPKRIPLPQAGGNYLIDESTGEAVRVEYTKLPGTAE